MVMSCSNEIATKSTSKPPPPTQMGSSNSKTEQCLNCQAPLKLANRIYECSGCGKKYMKNPDAKQQADQPKTRSEKPLTSSQETNKSLDQAPLTRKIGLRRRPEPEIIALDDSDEETERAETKHVKRKSDIDWPQDRAKLAKNDENAIEPAASSAAKERKLLEEGGHAASSPPNAAKKLDVISNNNLGARNGAGEANGHSAKSTTTTTTTTTNHYLELMFRDWGVRPSDVDELAPEKKRPSSERKKMPMRYMSLTSFTNQDPETYLSLSEAHGLCIRLTDDQYQVSITLGSDDVQYCLLGFHDPIYLLMVKVTKSFSALFNDHINQIGTYARDETDVRDSRLVILFNLKKSELTETLTYFSAFLNNLFAQSPAKKSSPGRVFSLRLSKTFEFVQKLFPTNEPVEAKKFCRKYVNEVVSSTLLSYPSPEHSDVATVTLSDLVCLQDGEFLNDNIISFYLKYLQTELLSPKDQQRIHIFNTFFYHRLTQKSGSKTKSEAGLNAAERRHNRVKKWTRNVNIFEKDFLVVPIIKKAHWYLAIICYPYLAEPVFKDRVKSEASSGAAGREESTPSREPRTRRTPAKSRDAADIDLDEQSFDEADPDDEDLSADLSTLSIEKDKICYKLPTILIFDSLPSGKHHQVIATLREYIECEYLAKFNQPYGIKLYGAKVIAPTQDNYFDCGIYLLQYVESFFTKPLEDFSFPINLSRNWFPRKAIDEKRQQIKSLIFRIQQRQQKPPASSAAKSVLKDLESLQ